MWPTFPDDAFPNAIFCNVFFPQTVATRSWFQSRRLPRRRSAVSPPVCPTVLLHFTLYHILDNIIQKEGNNGDNSNLLPIEKVSLECVAALLNAKKFENFPMTPGQVVSECRAILSRMVQHDTPEVGGILWSQLIFANTFGCPFVPFNEGTIFSKDPINDMRNDVNSFPFHKFHNFQEMCTFATSRCVDVVDQPVTSASPTLPSLNKLNNSLHPLSCNTKIEIDGSLQDWNLVYDFRSMMWEDGHPDMGKPIRSRLYTRLQCRNKTFPKFSQSSSSAASAASAAEAAETAEATKTSAAATESCGLLYVMVLKDTHFSVNKDDAWFKVWNGNAYVSLVDLNAQGRFSWIYNKSELIGWEGVIAYDFCSNDVIKYIAQISLRKNKNIYQSSTGKDTIIQSLELSCFSCDAMKISNFDDVSTKSSKKVADSSANFGISQGSDLEVVWSYINRPETLIFVGIFSCFLLFGVMKYIQSKQNKVKKISMTTTTKKRRVKVNESSVIGPIPMTPLKNIRRRWSPNNGSSQKASNVEKNDDYEGTPFIHKPKSKFQHLTRSVQKVLPYQKDSSSSIDLEKQSRKNSNNERSELEHSKENVDPTISSKSSWLRKLSPKKYDIITVNRKTEIEQIRGGGEEQHEYKSHGTMSLSFTRHPYSTISLNEQDASQPHSPNLSSSGKSKSFLCSE